MNTTCSCPGNRVARKARLLSWAAQLLAAAILAQTLFFKFTGAQEAVLLFEQLGAEPWGRIGTGLLEALAVILLLLPRLAALGGLLTAGLMGGALAAHLFRLGIEVQDDGGMLFLLALLTLACAVTVLALRRRELPRWLPLRSAQA